VTGLTADNFELREDQAVLPILSLRAVAETSDVPLSIAVLVDRSGSMEFKMKQWAPATVDLLAALRPIDQVRVSAFSDEATILQDFTHDAASLAASLAGIVPGGGSTRLFRAIVETIRDMRDLPGRNALILLTPD